MLFLSQIKDSLDTGPIAPIILKMRQLTLLNACFFLYALFTSGSIFKNACTSDVLSLDGHKLSQVSKCSKLLSCSKIAFRKAQTIQSSDSTLVAFLHDRVSFLTGTAPSITPLINSQLFIRPLYRYLRTGLSPPSFS